MTCATCAAMLGARVFDMCSELVQRPSSKEKWRLVPGGVCSCMHSLSGVDIGWWQRRTRALWSEGKRKELQRASCHSCFVTAALDCNPFWLLYCHGGGSYVEVRHVV